MLVDIGDDTWVEAGHVFCVRREEVPPGEDRTALTIVEASGGDVFDTGLDVKTVAERIRTAQREMLSAGVS